MSLTLYINKSDSHCECSYRGVDYRLKQCPICGGTWTHVSSEYAGISKMVAPMRPDLEPHFPWEEFWTSEAGRQATQELQDLNTAVDE